MSLFRQKNSPLLNDMPISLRRVSSFWRKNPLFCDSKKDYKQALKEKLTDLFFAYGVPMAGIAALIIIPLSPQLKGVQAGVHTGAALLQQAEAGESATLGGDVVPGVAELPASRPIVPLLATTSSFSGELTARGVIVLDGNSDTILWSKNDTTIRPLASISKLMAALVLLEQPMDWATTTAITATDWDGSSHHINVGEKFTAEELWHVGLIGSSNSAIRALVRISGISPEAFALAMNHKAQALGLSSLRFAEPTGLNSNNVGTARDVAGLLKYALRQEKIANTVGIGEYYLPIAGSNKRRRVWSTNWLLTGWIPNRFSTVPVIGKTGYTSSSGYNFTGEFTDPSTTHTVRVVILGARDNEARFTEANAVAEWVFEQFKWPDQAGYGDLVE